MGEGEGRGGGGVVCVCREERGSDSPLVRAHSTAVMSWNLVFASSVKTTGLLTN